MYIRYVRICPSAPGEPVSPMSSWQYTVGGNAGIGKYMDIVQSDSTFHISRLPDPTNPNLAGVSQIQGCPGSCEI